jgi:hypothetical protein
LELVSLDKILMQKLNLFILINQEVKVQTMLGMEVTSKKEKYLDGDLTSL